MPELRRVLIANRGEIAIRIAEAAASLGIESVGIFAPEDDRSLHTRATTQACRLPGSGVGAYLDVDAVLAVAAEAGCDALHPGYGFLAERADVADRCAAAGITFIGPGAAALALFGDKVRARERARTLGIPVVVGSPGALTTVDEARAAAVAIGFPVMLKAAAGGGGRGMRAVAEAGALADAFERCRGEAAAAFGDGALFLERLVERPRHIEVQILADGSGNVVHLHERDCSVQVRNQKVIEIAPAPNLDPAVRRRLLDDAVRLARETGYANAGTVEFLVAPDSGEHFFIECNPRIQVEHTVTEEITGIDLVAAQFRIAAGAVLGELGLADQAAVGAPRGAAVQARVVVAGPGTIEAYQEPSGVGVRVDACGYAGYAPPPQFDPLLAKVIGSTRGDVAAAVERTRRAVADFHLTGLATNLASLQAILAHPDVRGGDARTTLLAEHPELLDATAPPSGRAELLGAGSDGGRATPPAPTLAVGDGQVAVTAPGTATVVECHLGVGDVVVAGQGLVVLSAMKMETEVVAPVNGIVADLVALTPGNTVTAGETIVVLVPVEGAAATAGPASVETWQATLDDVTRLQQIAADRLAPGSQDPGVVRQRDRGKLTCRERIAALLDEGSFREVGSLAGFTSYDDEGRISAFTPASHVGGWGTIEGRRSIVCADDFTSRGGHSDGAIAAKSFYLDQLSMELGCPSVRLLDGSSGGGSVASMVPEQRTAGESAAQESSGAIAAGKPRVAGSGGSFLPGHLGSTEYARQLASVPVVNVLLGSVVGLGAAKAVLGHFSVMVRDVAQLFVAGPPVVSHAMGYDISKEDLGGWQVHCRNGAVDNLAETEDDALEQTRRFLSYLPASVHEAPPILPPRRDDPADRQDEELLTLVPRKRTTTFDVRRAIELLADRDSFFEIGPLWGTDQVVGFIRMDGHPMGVIASDSRHVNGGALTADGCDKLTRHLDLCDLFHLPVLNLVDNPGFAVGLEHEIAGTIRKGGEWMVAFAQIGVPLFTVLLRRSFGVAGNNYVTPQRQPSVRVAWPAADVGGIPPEGGIEAAYKRQLAEAADPAALRAELHARIESARGPIGPLNRFQLEELIDPRDTRRLVCEWVASATRTATRPDRLGPRALQFRP